MKNTATMGAPAIPQRARDQQKAPAGEQACTGIKTKNPGTMPRVLKTAREQNLQKISLLNLLD